VCGYRFKNLFSYISYFFLYILNKYIFSYIFLIIFNKNHKTTHTKKCVCGISKKSKKVIEKYIFLEKIYLYRLKLKL